MASFKTLELTEEEALVLKMHTDGKARKDIMAMLGMTKNRVIYLMGCAKRKSVAKERVKLQREALKLRS